MNWPLLSFFCYWWFWIGDLAPLQIWGPILLKIMASGSLWLAQILHALGVELKKKNAFFCGGRGVTQIQLTYSPRACWNNPGVNSHGFVGFVLASFVGLSVMAALCSIIPLTPNPNTTVLGIIIPILQMRKLKLRGGDLPRVMQLVELKFEPGYAWVIAIVLFCWCSLWNLRHQLFNPWLLK